MTAKFEVQHGQELSGLRGRNPLALVHVTLLQTRRTVHESVGRGDRAG